MTDKLYLITESQRDTLLVSLGMATPKTNSALDVIVGSRLVAEADMLQSLPMVASQPVTIDTEAVQVLARRTYRQHKNSIRGQQITEADSFENHLIWATAKLYTSPQALTQISADDITDEMLKYFTDQYKCGSVNCNEDEIVAAYNAVIKHREAT